MLSNFEKETIILFDKSCNTCKIYTADRTVANRLDKLYQCIRTEKIDGETAKTYQTDKKYISFRKDASFVPAAIAKQKRKMTPEHLDKLQAGRRRRQAEV